MWELILFSVLLIRFKCISSNPAAKLPGTPAPACRMPPMSTSRRQFLAEGSLGLLAIAATSCKQEAAQAPTPHEAPAGQPPAFATAPPAGPEVSPQTFAEAEKLVQVSLTEPERKEAVASWRVAMAPFYER